MKNDRRFDVDYLRVFGVLLVVIFHTLMIFILELWAITFIKSDTELSFCKPIGSIIHIFNMPLLFVLAGMATSYSLKSRSISEYIKNRVGKLLVPAVIGSVVLNACMVYIYQKGIYSNLSLVQHLKRYYLGGVGDLSGIEGGFTPAHLWFMFYLFVFSVVVIPFIRFYQVKRTHKYMLMLKEFFRRPYTILLLCIPIALSFYTNIVEDKNPLTYLLTFLLGYYISTEDEFRVAINRDKWGYTIGGVVFSIVCFTAKNNYIVTFGEQIAGLLITLALLGIGNTYFNKPNKFMSHLAGVSFYIYLFHMLINTMIGYIVIKYIEIGALGQFAIILVATILTSTICAEFVRGCKYKKSRQLLHF